MKALIGLFFMSCLMVGCSESQVPQAQGPQTHVNEDYVGTFSELTKYLPRSRPDSFILGEGLALNPDDRFSDAIHLAGARVNVSFSDAKEGLERIQPVNDHDCFSEIEYRTEKTNRKVYRLYLTHNLGDYHLILVGSRIVWEVTASPNLDREQGQALIAAKPHCAYYSSYVGYGIQAAQTWDFNTDQNFGFSSVRKYHGLNPGLISESTELNEVMEVAQDVQRIFRANGAIQNGVARNITVGNGRFTELTLDEASVTEKALNEALDQSPGYMATPIRQKLGFPTDVSGVAVEARIMRVDSLFDPHLKLKTRVIGLER